MAVININGGQINIAGSNSEIVAAQVNAGKKPGSGQTQVNVISGNGKIHSTQVNTDDGSYSNTVYKTNK